MSLNDYAAHYASLLARHYTWMFGLSWDEKVTEQRTILEPLLATDPHHPAPRGLAVDLGSGPGFQSIALAQLGFAPVLALDTSTELLAELASHAAGQPINPIAADILTLSDHVAPATAAVIVCMGDTLTHLPDQSAVRRLFSLAAAALAPGARFILTWRDLTPELAGPRRFIPVRADSDTILTCFLEYTSPTTVQIHDLVYTRNPVPNPAPNPAPSPAPSAAAGPTPNGTAWTLATSSYPKLRLSPLWVAAELTAAGLTTQPPATAGRLSLAIAQKP